ncbi:MAG: chorismate lyase [Pseudomonadota bacterium]
MTASHSPSSDHALPDWADRATVDGTAADWLMTTRLMTDDIRRSVVQTVRIRVLSAKTVTLPATVTAMLPSAEHDGWLREIEIRSDEQVFVHAYCFVPATTLTAQPWLMTLGEQPLGAELAKRPAERRAAMQFQPSSATASPFASTVGAWARRSVFDIDAQPLLLIEHMTSHLLDIPRRID